MSENDAKIDFSMQFILDKSHAKDFTISNDAFFYLQLGDEPLDEANLIEAESVANSFINGFDIVEWRYIDNGKVYCKLAPYIAEQSYDAFIQATNYHDMRIRYNSPSNVTAWYIDNRDNSIRPAGTHDIIDADTNPSFYTDLGSRFFLKRFTKVNKK